MTRTRARMRAEYLDYSGHAHQISQQTKAGNNSLRPCTFFPHSSFSPQQPQVVPSGLEPQTLWLLAIRSDQLSHETSCWPLQLLGGGGGGLHAIPSFRPSQLQVTAHGFKPHG